MPKDSFCLDDTRTCEYTLDGDYMNVGLTVKLNNPDFFGPNGIVKCELELSPLTDISSAQAIEDQSCDIIFTGSFTYDTLDNHAIVDTITSVPLPALNAIREWSMMCDNNLVIGTQAETWPWGYKVEDKNRNPNSPVFANSLFSIFDGPFGSVTEFRQGGTFQGIFTQVPPTGAETLALDDNGLPTVVLDSVTNDLLLGDIGIFCSGRVGRVSEGDSIETNNDILVCNIFALGCQIAEGTVTSSSFVKTCPGESIVLPNGNSVSIEGVYRDTFLAANGCDSILYTKLTNYNIDTVGIEHKRCSGDGFSIFLDGVQYDESNPTGEAVLQSRFGCDSIIRVRLEFGNDEATYIDEEVCIGSGHFVTVNNVRYDESNPSGREILQSQYGCDSVVTIDLKYRPLSETYISESPCESSGFNVLVKNVRYDESNPTGREILQNRFGCDSMIYINLDFQPASITQIHDRQCKGNGYFVLVNNVRYDELNPVGQEVLLNQYGCDSIIEVNLEFNPETNFELEEISCRGSGLSRLVNNIRYDESNPIGQEILLNSAGCDSIVDINLIFYPGSKTHIEETTCRGSGLEVAVSNKTYNELNPSGREVLENQYGCDSIIDINLIFTDLDSTYESFGVCPGGSIQIDSEQYFPGTSGAVVYERIGQCDSVFLFDVYKLEPPDVQIDPSVTVDLNNQFVFSNDISTEYQIQWNPQTGISCSACANPLIIGSEFIPEYLVSITDEYNCLYNYRIDVNYNRTPYIPNAFSPNNDGINDDFRLYFGAYSNHVQVKSYRIFDRWGGMLYEQENFDVDSASYWWKGENINEGIYIYIIEVEYENGEIAQFSGDITVLK